VKRPVIAVLLLAGLASSAQAVYVVLLKNGTRVVARDKYTIKGGNALIVLKNGTLTSVPLSQVDVPATEKLNAKNLGDAIPLEWADGGQRPLATPTPTPSVTTLGHIRAGEGRPIGEAAGPTPTPGIAYRAARFSDEQVDQAFQQGLESYHLYLYRSSQGTQPDFYFMEIQVNGQAEVLRALQAVATTYHLLQEKAPERTPKRVELQLLNESGREAGVFRLSPEDARLLATGEVKPEDFFVQHVIF
jgi:hypothetical protein